MTLVDCFSPVFELVQNALGDEADAEALREEMGRRIEQGVVKASAEYTPGIMLSARRLVSIWVDNRLGGEEWTGRKRWLENPLLHEKIGSGETHLIELAERLDGASAEDAQLAMLMLECLGRGFHLDAARRGAILEILTQRFGERP